MLEIKLTSDEKIMLWRAADDARKAAYVPYSGISVGAALLTDGGEIYTGANIENCAYSPSVCAERVALFKAINAGERDFRAIAVAGGRSDSAPVEHFPPCGVCRQVMKEFCTSNFEIVLGDDGYSVTLGELLPLGFGKEHL